MEKEEYKIIYNIEHNYWWYVGLRKLVFASLDRFIQNKRNSMLLDAGCGTGSILGTCNGYSTYGIDISEEALKFCRLRNLKNILKGSICSLPFKDNTFNIIISLDVLYHLQVSDDLKTLKEMYRVTAQNGILLLNLPAYDFLKSMHDKMIHTRQRYTLRDLRDKVEKAGFSIEIITYRNTLLFPLIALMRIVKKYLSPDKRKIESDVKPLPVLINKLLQYILLLENRLIIGGLSLPFGLSIFCVARKKDMIPID